MNSEPLALNRLIESVADGHPLEWDTITANPGSSEERLIKHLRVLVGVAEGHRTAARDETAATGGASPGLDPEHPGAHWGHLLLKEKIGEGAFGSDGDVSVYGRLKLLDAGKVRLREFDGGNFAAAQLVERRADGQLGEVGHGIFQTFVV